MIGNGSVGVSASPGWATADFFVDPLGVEAVGDDVQRIGLHSQTAGEAGL